MFVITYDEHGGFFDHVPPPGTELGPQEWRGKVPRIHPDGADHLGVRVPAFVISPLVEAGSVCHEVLDHTSILKTILLRHRTRIHSSVFTSFGPRVNEAAHLGAALSDAATGGQAAQMQPPEFPPEIANTPDARWRDRDDFPESMRRAFLPRARPRA
jgi:phospholipase C